MKCFKKWGCPISSLDSPKKTAHDKAMVSAESPKPYKPLGFWKRPRPKACLGKTGAVPGARAAKVLEKHGSWVGFEGTCAGKLCFCIVLPWFLPFKMTEHVGFLEKNAQKSLCPREHLNETGDIPLLCLITTGSGISNGDALQLWFPTMGTPVISISLGLGPRGLSLIISKWEPRAPHHSKKDMELGYMPRILMSAAPVFPWCSRAVVAGLVKRKLALPKQTSTQPNWSARFWFDECSISLQDISEQMQEYDVGMSILYHIYHLPRFESLILSYHIST